MLRGLRTLGRSSTSSNNVAAGSGAQGASVINKAQDAGNSETALVKVEKSASKDLEASAVTVASAASWTPEEQLTYVESLGVCKLPGEEHILRFLADSLTASPLPAPWAMHRDDDGKIFYGNTTTGETRWEHPLEDVIRELAGVCRVCISLSKPMRERSIGDLRETWEAQAKEEFSQWYSVKDTVSNKDYYCNSLTGQTMWEHPAEVLLPGHFMKLKSADRLLDDAYLQELLSLSSSNGNGATKSWTLMKRTLESDASNASTEAGYKDAHKAIKAELAARTLELQAAKENEEKVKAEFEALKARFEEHVKSMSEANQKREQLEAELLAEQKRLQSAITECEAWKKQATTKEGDGAEALQERVQLQVEVESQKQKAQEALAEVETLRSQAAELSKLSTSSEKAKGELEAMLEAERKRTQEVLAECASLQDATQRGNQVALEKQDVEVKLEAERLRAEQAASEVQAMRTEAQSAQQASATQQSQVQQQKKEMEEQLKAERELVREAQAELELLKSQASEDSLALQKAIEEQLEVERKKTREVAAELENVRVQAKGHQDAAQVEREKATQAQSNTEAQCSLLQAQIDAERKRVAEVLAECAILKSQKESAEADVEAAIREEKLRQELKEQLETERKRAQEAAVECEKLKTQAAKDANAAVEEEKQRQALQEALHAERFRAEQAAKECEMLKAQAPVDLQNAIEEEHKRAQLQEQFRAEKVRADKALEEVASLKQQAATADAQAAQEEKQRQALQEQLVKEKTKVSEVLEECATLKKQAKDSGEASAKVAAVELQEEMRRLQQAASRAQEAERSLHAKLETLQAELFQEKARADQEASKYVAARDVQEAMVQEMIAANTEKRELRETLQAQLLEEQRRAKDFEAKYLELQVHEEKADRQFVDKLIRDKESLEKSSQRLSEQLAKANLAANELEAKFNRERLQLEAANVDRQELLTRQRLTAEEAQHADEVLQQQIRSAQEAEVKLSSRASALKALMEGERAKVEQLTDGFAKFAEKVDGSSSNQHLEDQLQELNGQMVEMRAMLAAGKMPEDRQLTKALNQVSVANEKIQTAVAKEQEVMDRSSPAFKAKKSGKIPRVRELHGKLWASTDDAIQIGQKVRHTKIESSLVKQQTLLCKQLVEEVVSCQRSQSVEMLKSKAKLKLLNEALRDEVENARLELQMLEKQAAGT